METAYRDACLEWLKGASGRDFDAVSRAQLEDMASRLTFSGDEDGIGTLTLPRRSRGGGVVTLIATRPPVEQTEEDDGEDDDVERTATSLRVAERKANGSEVELFAVHATATGVAPKWSKLQVRTSCDGQALIEVRLSVAPVIDEVADLLDLFLSLPWLPETDLFLSLIHI